MRSGEVVLVFEAPAPPISMNEGDSWKVRKASAAWRDRAYFAWCEAHPGVGPAGRRFPSPASVHVALAFPTNRRRDPINFAKTVKHIVDGIVMAGAWPDDTPEFVTQNIPSLLKGNQCVVRVAPPPADVVG
jgi:hypothetical protein